MKYWEENMLGREADTVAEQIMVAIATDIGSRKGLGNELEDCNDETLKEMGEVWVDTIEQIIRSRQ